MLTHAACSLCALRAFRKHGARCADVPSDCRQVKGLQTEYGRLSDESKHQGGASSDLSSEVQRTKAALSKAEADRAAAVEKANAAEKARRTAENNADALLTQTKVSLLHVASVIG